MCPPLFKSAVHFCKAFWYSAIQFCGHTFDSRNRFSCYSKQNIVSPGNATRFARMGSSWYLEHVTSRERIFLYSGENLVGRHSCCNINLSGTYVFVSREHVKIVVSDAGVIVQDWVSPSSSCDQYVCLNRDCTPRTPGTASSSMKSR